MNVQIEVSQNTIRIILPFDASPNIIVKNESKIPLQSEQQIITKKKPIYPITSQYSYFIFKNETVSEYKQIDLLITLLKLFDSMDHFMIDIVYYQHTGEQEGISQKQYTDLIHQEKI